MPHPAGDRLNELELIVSKRKAIRRLKSYLAATFAVFISSFCYLMFVIVLACLSGTPVELSDWVKIIVVSSIMIAGCFVALFVYEIRQLAKEDRNLIEYCREHPRFMEDLKRIEDEYGRKKRF